MKKALFFILSVPFITAVVMKLVWMLPWKEIGTQDGWLTFLGGFFSCFGLIYIGYIQLDEQRKLFREQISFQEKQFENGMKEQQRQFKMQFDEQKRQFEKPTIEKLLSILKEYKYILEHSSIDQEAFKKNISFITKIIYIDNTNIYSEKNLDFFRKNLFYIDNPFLYRELEKIQKFIEEIHNIFSMLKNLNFQEFFQFLDYYENNCSPFGYSKEMIKSVKQHKYDLIKAPDIELLREVSSFVHYSLFNCNDRTILTNTFYDDGFLKERILKIFPQLLEYLDKTISILDSNSYSNDINFSKIYSSKVSILPLLDEEIEKLIQKQESA